MKPGLEPYRLGPRSVVCGYYLGGIPPPLLLGFRPVLPRNGCRKIRIVQFATTKVVCANHSRPHGNTARDENRKLGLTPGSAPEILGLPYAALRLLAGVHSSKTCHSHRSRLHDWINIAPHTSSELK
jgi:hypothetical protein